VCFVYKFQRYKNLAVLIVVSIELRDMMKVLRKRSLKNFMHPELSLASLSSLTLSDPGRSGLHSVSQERYICV
jgi:hypothetical protein